MHNGNTDVAPLDPNTPFSKRCVWQILTNIYKYCKILTVVDQKHTCFKRGMYKKEESAGRLSGAWGYQCCLFILIMIWISIFILISIWILISPHPPPPHAGAVRRRGRVGAWGGRYTKYAQDIDKYWTSFCSPIGSRWELRTNRDDFAAWNCVPRLFDVSPNR